MCAHPHCSKPAAGVHARLRPAVYCSASCRARHGAILRQQRRRDERLDHVARWVRDLSRKYGLTTEQWHDMLRRQTGRCSICSCPLVDVHVDHCHSTGRVRGLLCSRCNQGLGYFADDPGRLVAAARYLEAAQGPQ